MEDLQEIVDDALFKNNADLSACKQNTFGYENWIPEIKGLETLPMSASQWKFFDKIDLFMMQNDVISAYDSVFMIRNSMNQASFDSWLEFNPLILDRMNNSIRELNEFIRDKKLEAEYETD